MYNKGTKYLENSRVDKALQCFKKQARTHLFKELYLNMGNCYRHMSNSSEALRCYEIANSTDTPFADGTFTQTDYPLALNNLGLLAYWRGDDSLAISYYNRALTMNPLHYDAVWNYGNALLRSTNCSSTTGWEAYEYRFKRSGAVVRIDNSLPTWDGVSPGTAIVVQCEQGIGDKIMFGRYLSLVALSFETVYVVCHPSLDVFFSSYKIVRSLAECPATVTIGLCSLAKIYGAISSNWLEGKFSERVFTKTRLNIGCVWSGSTTHVNNANRSCPSTYFSKLADYGNLYGLNPGSIAARSVEDISSLDWTETASTLLGLDVVVTVDTSVVHLAGTLGVPCIMIQPLHETDFRWGPPGCQNVWYSSVIVVPNNGWDMAFAAVRKILEEIKK